MADDELLDPREIEALLQEHGAGAARNSPGDSPEDAGASPAASESPAPADSETTGETDDVRSPGPAAEALLDQAEADLMQALSSQSGNDDSRRTGLRSGEHASLADARPLEFSSFDSAPAGAGAPASLKSLQDVELDLRIELGRAELLIEEVLELRAGSVVPLDKLAGDPVDILVNGRLVARGEVLVLNNNFCVRVAEILAPEL